jgi:hypothetical protein
MMYISVSVLGLLEASLEQAVAICLAYLLYFFFFVVLGLEPRAYTLSHSTSPFL